MLDRVHHYLKDSSRSFLLSLTLLQVVAFALLDRLTGPQIIVYVAYFAPVALASWYIGRRAGALVAICAALAWLWADWGASHLYSHPIIPFWNDAMHLLAFLLFGHLVSTVHGALETVRRQAATDPLTGLLNKRAFGEAAERERRRSRRYQHPLSLVYFDLDHFKTVNDTHGHAAGDAVLRCVASVMKSALRGTDVLGRVGGDEFVVLLVESDPEQSARTVADLRERLLTAMAEMDSPVTFSIGMISYRQVPDWMEAMMEAADRLMYGVKRAGRDAVRQVVADDAP